MTFIGLDYYYRLDTPEDFDNLLASRNWLVDMDPAGLYGAIKLYSVRFPGKPVFVTENGMATEDGRPRPDGYKRCHHLADHVQQVQRAVADGIDVPGYLYWSITDNYEWGELHSRFGLYTVDIATDPALRRKPTDAVASYRGIVERRGVPEGYRAVKTEAGFRAGHRELACPPGPARWLISELPHARFRGNALLSEEGVRKAPKSGVATATSTKEATCAPTSTPFSRQFTCWWTTSCLSARDRALRPRSRTPS